MLDESFKRAADGGFGTSQMLARNGGTKNGCWWNVGAARRRLFSKSHPFRKKLSFRSTKRTTWMRCVKPLPDSERSGIPTIFLSCCPCRRYRCQRGAPRWAAKFSRSAYCETFSRCPRMLYQRYVPPLLHMLQVRILKTVSGDCKISPSRNRLTQFWG